MEFLKTDQQIKKVIFNVFQQEDYKIYQRIWTQRKSVELHKTYHKVTIPLKSAVFTTM
jgi:hypothetical protein